MKWIKKCFMEYVTVLGRARRKEFWSFAIFVFLGIIIFSALDNSLGIDFKGYYYGPFSIIFMILTFLPFLSVLVRRLHDIDCSAWFLLIFFVPCIGSLWLLILTLFSGTPGINRYGNNPRIDNLPHSDNYPNFDNYHDDTDEDLYIH